VVRVVLPLLFSEVHDHLLFCWCWLRCCFPDTILRVPSPPPCRLSHRCW
jgi:hypothetical protein